MKLHLTYFKQSHKYLLALSIILFVSFVQAADYAIDRKGMHAAIQFKISHLGYSWLWGRFNDFDGTFSYDADAPNKSKISVTVNTKSLDSNHAERDKHLRSDDFLHVDKYPEARFQSTTVNLNADGIGTVNGNLTLHGVTKPLTIQVNRLGEGKDPWGGYRIGFEGSTKITLADYGITFNLGPASKELELIFSIEGIRQ